MTRTRWKVSAVALGLSLGGLAAAAGVPGRCDKAVKAGRCDPEPPMVAPGGAVPVIPAPAPIQIPTVPAPTVATPPELPPVVPAAASEPKAAQAEEPKTPAKAEKPPALPPVQELSLPVARPIPAEPPASAKAPAKPDEKPAVAPLPIPDSPAPPTKPAPTVPSAGSSLPPPLPLNEPTPATLPTPTPAEPPAPVAVEKKLKVMLHMGDDRPRFEVRDGDEVYLKVVCDKVDVKSPSEKGEAVSTLKASGKVTFVTPGGEGNCDELTVAPGTGQVVVSGKVTFKYSWGKAETTVSGDRMTFRLGTAPGLTAPATAVTASYRK